MQQISQGEGSRGDPRDAKLEVEVPEEVLAKGWLPVLQYLRELRDQVGPVLI